VSFAEHQRYNLQLARERLNAARDEQKVAAEKRRQASPFHLGQSVWLDTRNLPTTYTNVSDQCSRKLQDVWTGPFKLVKASPSPNAWYLDLPTSWRIQQPINVSLLKPDWSDTSRPRLPPPMRQSVRGAEYLVESVIAHERRRSTMYYWLPWVGWGAEGDTWEPLRSLDFDGSREMVEEYHREQGLPEPKWGRKPRRGIS
jgi:hypothetical protein